MSKPLHKYSEYFKTIGLFTKIKNFEELEKKIINLPETPGRTSRQTKGDAFEVFAEALINTCKKFNSKQVYPDGKIPIKLLNKLGMNILDKGKDGIYIDKNDKINSYQVKFSSNRKSLSWRNLSTFLSVSENANLRLLISNSNKVEDEFLNKRDVLSFNYQSLYNLTREEIRNICAWINQKKDKKEIPKPDPKYQKEALVKINNELSKKNRATTVMACGSGKTLIGLWTFEKINPKLTVVFVPSIGLIKQIRADWLGNTIRNNIRTISICSSNDRSSREDEIKVSQKDLDFKITTNPKELKRFIDFKSKDLKIIFCTYQSSSVIKKALGKRKIIDFGIFDEAHRTAKVSKYKKYNIKDSFSLALYDENIYIKKRLFMTATRRVEDKNKTNKEGDAKLSVSMDKEEIYGKVCYPLSFHEAAQKNIIAKSKFIISHVTSDEISSSERKISKTLVNNTSIKTEQVADQIAIKKAVEKYKIKKLFTFHTTVNQAKSFTKNGPEGIRSHLPKFFTTSIDGQMRSRLREARMQEFRENQYSIISNARCLIEGIDVPEVSMVAFITPKQSEVDIVQATGRALRNRNQKNKRFGYVLIPIYVERKAGEKISKAVQRTDYEKVANVIKAMGEHDDEIKQIISDLLISENRGKGHSKKAIRNLEKRIEIIHPDISKKILLNHIGSKTISKLITKWDEMIGMLYAYKDKFGNCDVPFIYPQNDELGKWVHAVRKRRLNNTLHNFQIDQLNQMGFSWSLEGEDRNKNEDYLNLRDLQKEHNLSLDRPLKKIAKNFKVELISGYHLFKSSKTKKGILTKSFFFKKDQWNKIIHDNKVLNWKERKILLNDKNFLDISDFIKYCNLDNYTFHRISKQANLECDYIYLKKGQKITKNGIEFFGRIYNVDKKKIIEKKLGYKIIEHSDKVVSWSQALNMGCDANDFIIRKNTNKSKRKKIIKSIGKCLFPNSKNKKNFSKAFDKITVLNFLKKYKKITLSRDQIIKEKLIDSREMTKILYKETGLKTVFFKLIDNKILIPRGRGLRLGKKKVINYFPFNEIENYKMRTLKKFKIKSNEKFIFNYNNLKKYDLLTDAEICKKLNCSINNVRSLRYTNTLKHYARYAGPASSKNASYATKKTVLSNFIKNYGKYINNYNGLIICNHDFKRFLIGENLKIKFEDLVLNKKINKVGFSFYKGKFVFIIKYEHAYKYLLNNSEFKIK